MSNSAIMALLFLKAKKAIEVIIRCGLVLHPTVPMEQLISASTIDQLFD